jgi:hypothetical protein
VRATVLNPGDTNKPVDQLTSFAPTLVASKQVALGPADISGQLTTSVFREASGFLDFAYRVTLNSSATGTLNRIAANGFAGLATDVFFFNMPLEMNSPPSGASRSLSGPGANVLFNFGTALSGANPNSALLVIRTNATGFDSSGSITIDYDSFGNMFTVGGAFAPLALAPEPGAMALALIGFSPLGLVGGIRWWRRKTNP